MLKVGEKLSIFGNMEYSLHTLKFNLLFLLTAVVLAIFGITGCGSSDNNALLVQADSLLSTKQYEKASQLLKTLEADKLPREDFAYYALLITQSNYKNYVVATTDSLINVAVSYYEQSGDHEKLVRSLIYLGCVNEELGNHDVAVDCYHKAETMADPDDINNRAFAKLRLAALYHTQVIGAKTIAVEKYKEALALYEQLHDSHYMVLCLGELGAIYRNMPQKGDSALIYIDKAITLSKSSGEAYYLFGNYTSRAQYYARIAKDYRKAIADARAALTVDSSLVDHPRAHYTAALAYLKLGNTDSCLYFLHHAPQATSAVDSMDCYELQAEIARSAGQFAQAYAYNGRAEAIADSMLIGGLNHRLRAVERRYDVQQSALKNAQLKTSLQSTLLLLAGIAIAALVLLLLFLRYKAKLRLRNSEFELLKADLDTSLASLQTMRAGYEQNLTLEREKTQEFKAIIDEQIQIVQQLMQWSYELGGNAEAFTKKFNALMVLPEHDRDLTYWSNLQALVNGLHDGILEKAKATSHGTLREDEINFLALYCCGFSRAAIMVCMRYKHITTISNKKRQIAQKLSVATLDDYLHPLLTKMPPNHI